MTRWCRGRRDVTPLAAIFVSGFLSIAADPAPGTVYQGDGQGCRIVLARDNLTLNQVTVRNCDVRSPANVSGLTVRDSTFQGAHKDAGGCYSGGGQALQIENARGNALKTVQDNTFSDYDCIAISIYSPPNNPAHGIWITGNQALDPYAWSFYGPSEDYSGLTLSRNHFAKARVSHSGYFPTPAGQRLSVTYNAIDHLRLDLADPRTEPFRDWSEFSHTICGNSASAYRYIPTYVEVESPSLPVGELQRTNSVGASGYFASGVAYVAYQGRLWRLDPWTYAPYPASSPCAYSGRR